MVVINKEPGQQGPRGEQATFPFYNSENYPSIDAALLAAKATGGTVAVPKGTFERTTTLKIPSNVTLMGSGYNGTIIKLKNGANVNLLETEGAGAGGAEKWRLFNITFDGNKANNVTGNIYLDGRAYSIDALFVYNLPGKLEFDSTAAPLPEDDEAFVSNVRYMNCGEALIFKGPHDTIFTNILSRRTGAGACVEALNVSSWVNLHTYGNTPLGIVAGAGTNFIDCQAEGTTSWKLKIIGAGVSWIGGRIFSAGAEDAKLGILIAGGTGHQIRDVLIENCDAGSVKFETAGFNTVLSGHVFGSEAKAVITGIPDAATVDASQLHVSTPLFLVEESLELNAKLLGARGPSVTSDGNLDMLGRLAMTERATDPSQTANQVKTYAKDDGAGKTLLKAQFGAGTAIVLAKEKAGVLVELASAEELVPTDEGPVTTVKVTGAVEIKKIKILRAGLILNLLFTSTATVANGENLKIGSNFIGGANRMLQLVSDGTNWQEVSRDPARANGATELTERTVGTEFEASATRNTIVTGMVTTATATRTKILVKVSGVVVFEAAASVAATGTSIIPFAFMVAAGSKWKWEKIEGTVENLKTSYTII